MGELAHALLPVVELLDGTVVLIFTALGGSVVNEVVHLLLPLAEDSCVVEDERDLLDVAALAETLAKALVEWFQHNVALERLFSLFELLGEPIECLRELFLLVRLTVFPVFWVHLLEHGTVDVVDEGLQGSHSVLRDLAEEDLLVAGARRVDGSAGLGVPEEVHSLAEELVVETIGDLELSGLAELFHFALLILLVGLLVVDEQVGGTLTCHPALENLLVLRLVERVSLVFL